MRILTYFIFGSNGENSYGERYEQLFLQVQQKCIPSIKSLSELEGAQRVHMSAKC